MYCNKCGSKLPDNSVFCISCGAKLVGLEQEKSTEKQKYMVESVTERQEEADEQSIPPIMQMKSDLMTVEESSAEIVQLGHVLEQAVKENKKEKVWARIRVAKKVLTTLKFTIVYTVFAALLLSAFYTWMYLGMKEMFFIIFMVFFDIFFIAIAVVHYYRYKEITTSDLFVSSIKCYGIDIYGRNVSVLLNEIVDIKREKRLLNNKTMKYGYFSLSTVRKKYIFASVDIDTVCASFSKYLLEREKNK
ncbi:MAG: zinc-ribbon domain-containing protein [Lachnospiraceae bacterium]